MQYSQYTDRNLKPEPIYYGAAVLSVPYTGHSAPYFKSMKLQAQSDILFLQQKYVFVHLSSFNTPQMSMCLEHTDTQLESVPFDLTSFLLNLSCHARARRHKTAAEL